MHIPDGFLDVKTWATLWGVSAATLGIAVKKSSLNIEDKHIPLLGVTSAFIFAAQMINFPVAGGTSGHFIGGVLAAILLGPYSGLLVMATVLTVQCFLFQDGGLTALGANIFNMGIVETFGGYYLYSFLTRIIPGSAQTKFFVSAFIASVIAVFMAAIFCAIELGISGTAPLKQAVIAMGTVHLLIGFGEGIITVLVLGFIKRVRSDLLEIDKI